MLGLVSGFIAGQEWIIIIVLAAVLIFGAKKIPELAKILNHTEAYGARYCRCS